MAIPSNNPQSENILKRKEVSNKIGDESITMSDLPNELQQSKKLPVKNVIESKNEKRNETYDNNLPSSITCRKRPINKNQSDNTKRKRTDEALSISQNIPNYNSCNFAMLQSNSQRYDPPNKKIVPGRRTYAETLEYGKKVVIFGDSHMKRIDRKKLNQNINGKAVMKNFDGVTSEELEYYVYPTIKKEKPDRVIVHVGSNNVNFYNVENSTAEEVAERILKVGEICKFHGVEDVAISSVLIKKNLVLGKFIRNVNIILEKLCHDRSFEFINNDNIYSTLVSDDGVHLTRPGSSVLLKKFIYFMNETNSNL